MPPSPFVIQWVPYVAARVRPRPSALDVATGAGRHLPVLAAAGFRPFGVDIALDDLLEARREAVVPPALWCADLTRTELPAARFDLVLVTRYLDRSLFPSLAASVVPGGFVMYETFTRRQLEHGTGPRSPAHLLELGELRRRFAEPRFDVLFYEERDAPEAVARLVAQRV
jgi:SAM-dependent methyltransferase